MKTDLIVTAKDRPKLLSEMLSSLKKTTPREQYRLTVLVDGPNYGLDDLLQRYFDTVDYKIVSSRNEGLGPALNKLIPFVGGLKSWEPAPLTCYVQDDVVFADGWLERLVTKYVQLSGPLKLAFATGHHAVEHYDDPRAQRTNLGPGMYTSRYIRATCMMAYHEVWSSMLPIPSVDLETGLQRGKPDNGLGSGVDWHFLRVHPGSVTKTGRTNLVIPGLVVHAGYKDSTWLKRELPESTDDMDRLPKPPLQKPCDGLFGACFSGKLTDGLDFLCEDCRDEFNSDPEAYK